MTKAKTTALNHEMAAKHRLFGQALKVDECRVRFGKVDVRHDDRRRPSGFGGYPNGRPQPIRSEVKLMVAERGGVEAHSEKQLQFRASLARRRAERGPVAIVAIIEHQHRALSFARCLSLHDQWGKTCEAAPSLVIIQREGGVVRLRAHADEIGVDVVGVQDREGLFSFGGYCRHLT